LTSGSKRPNQPVLAATCPDEEGIETCRGRVAYFFFGASQRHAPMKRGLKRDPAKEFSKNRMDLAATCPDEEGIETVLLADRQRVMSKAFAPSAAARSDMPR